MENHEEIKKIENILKYKFTSLDNLSKISFWEKLKELKKKKKMENNIKNWPMSGLKKLFKNMKTSQSYLIKL